MVHGQQNENLLVNTLRGANKNPWLLELLLERPVEARGGLAYVVGARFVGGLEQELGRGRDVVEPLDGHLALEPEVALYVARKRAKRLDDVARRVGEQLDR